MYFKKHKSTVKEFTDFSSLSLKDLEKVKIYYFANIEALKNRELEIVEIENRNKEIRQNKEYQSKKYFEYKDKYVKPIQTHLDEAKKFLNQHKISNLSLNILIGNSIKWGKGYYRKNADVSKVISEINNQQILLKQYEEENPYKEYFKIQEIKNTLPLLDKKLFKFSGVSHYVFFKSIQIDSINEYIQKIHDFEKQRKKELDELKARSANNDAETRKIAETFKRKYPLSRQLEKLTDCPYCSNLLDTKKAHLEHIYPVSKGGKSSSKNLVWICSTCNLKKSNKTLIGFVKIHKMNRELIESNLDLLDKEY